MQLLNSTINLSKLATQKKSEYNTGNPFPSIVLDNIFDTHFLESVLDEFPNLDQLAEDKYNDENQSQKQTLSSYEKMGTKSQRLIDYLNSAPFLDFLQTLTGIMEPLIPDPRLEGGGYHETKTGGFLRLHVDFNKHYKTKLDRRLNLLLFLNKNWEDEYGGEVELWNESLSEKGLCALPLFNRMVIFDTTSSSFHGQPSPLTCPETISRKSIAIYYYSNGRPQSEIIQGMEDHSTIFKGRTISEIAAAQKAKNHYKRKQLIWSLIPPIAFKIRRKILALLN